MKIFQNKNLFKKLMIIFLIITIFSFCMPKAVRAKDDDGVGGKLLKPVIDLMLGLGDGIMDILHKIIYNQDQSSIIVDMSTKWWDIFSTVMLAIFVTVVVAAAVIVTAGAVVAGLEALGVTLSSIGVGTVLMVSLTSGIVAATVYNSNMLPDDLKLPLYSISPEEIFSNKIPLFDVDFFNPSDETISVDNTKNVVKRESMGSRYEYTNKYLVDNCGYDRSNSMTETFTEGNGIAQSPNKYTQNKWNYNGKVYTYCYSSSGSWFCTRFDANTQGENWEWLNFDSTENGGIKYKWDTNVATAIWDDGAGEVYEDVETTVVTGSVNEITSIAKQLQSTISTWYNILRDIALVALLSILVYVGIRIIISSTATDKAKYKQLLIDWIVAICLLFVMQYIMSFANMFVNKITQVVVDAKPTTNEYHELIADDDGKIKQVLESEEMKGIVEDQGLDTTKMESDGYVLWKTNLLGLARMSAEMGTDSTATYAGYAIMFVILVLFTVYFIFTYLKRVLYMAFLTIVAPLVALTYPIDKMNDGKAQAFDMWFKEYIFNLLIQPLHLLLYTILVSSAFELANTNMLYSLVAIAFMIPAEKLMRKFFGFEKAQTPGFLAGPAGAALTMSGLNKIMGHKPPKFGKDGGPGGNNNSSSNDDDGGLPRISSGWDEKEALINGFGDESKENKIDKESEKDKQNNNNVIDFQQRNMERQNPNSMVSKIQPDEQNKTPIENGNNKPSDNNKVFNEQNAKAKKKNRVLRGIASVGKSYTRDMKGKMQKSIKNMHPLRTATKVAMGAAGATAFGMAAGTIGLATGDPSKAFQFASAGVMGGYKLGSSTADSVGGLLNSSIDMHDEFQKGYYDKDEYEKVKQKEYIKKMKKDSANIEKLEDAGYEDNEVKFIMNNVVDDYARDGIYDMDDIIAGYKAEKEDNLSREEAKAGIKYSNRIGQRMDKMKGDDISKYQNTWTKEFAENNTVKTKNINPEKLGEETMRIASIINKRKYKY